MCRRYEPLPSYRHLEKGQHLFSESPIFDIFWQQHPNKLRYKNKEIRRRVIFMFRKLQNNITCFFVWNTFISNTRLIVDLKYNSLRYQKEFFTDLQTNPTFLQESLEPLPSSIIVKKSQPPLPINKGKVFHTMNMYHCWHMALWI